MSTSSTSYASSSSTSSWPSSTSPPLSSGQLEILGQRVIVGVYKGDAPFQFSTCHCLIAHDFNRTSIIVLDRPLPAIAVIKHIFNFAAFWKIVLLFGVKCFSPDCLWLIVALFLSSSRMIFFHPVCSSCSLEAPGSWPGYLTANPHFKENTKQTPGIQMYKWTFVTQFSPPPQMKDLKEKFCKTSGAAQRQGCIFVWCAPIVSWPRIMCSQVRMLKFLEPSREMRKIRVSEAKKIVLDFLLTNMQWISD